MQLRINSFLARGHIDNPVGVNLDLSDAFSEARNPAALVAVTPICRMCLIQLILKLLFSMTI